MATDIWIHIEYKSRKNKKYKYAGEFDGERLYSVFGILAGVRSDIKSIYPPRGLPDDASDELLCAYKNRFPDCHTPSYLYTSEFRECLDIVDELIHKYDEKEGTTYNPNWLKSYEFIYEYMQTSDKEGEPARMVFWFDN